MVVEVVVVNEADVVVLEVQVLVTDAAFGPTLPPQAASRKRQSAQRERLGTGQVSGTPSPNTEPAGPMRAIDR
jgi:hypothetical protein